MGAQNLNPFEELKNLDRQVDLVTEMNGRPIQASPDRITFSCRVLPKPADRTPSTVPPAISGKHTAEHN